MSSVNSGVKVEDEAYDPSRPKPTRKVLYSYPLANMPEKTMIGLHVSWPPNGATPPHRHGGASVTGVVIEGTLLNKMNDQPTYKLEKHDTWYEAPGCHHRTTSNPSATEPAAIIATFIVDTKLIEEEGMKLWWF